MSDPLGGHGVQICRCGTVISNCGCPKHQDVVLTVQDSCPECEGSEIPDGLMAVEDVSEECDVFSDLEILGQAPSAHAIHAVQAELEKHVELPFGPFNPHDAPTYALVVQLRMYAELNTFMKKVLSKLGDLNDKRR
jgi:hypothetical protein